MCTVGSNKHIEITQETWEKVLMWAFCSYPSPWMQNCWELIPEIYSSDFHMPLDEGCCDEWISAGYWDVRSTPREQIHQTTIWVTRHQGILPDSGLISFLFLSLFFKPPSHALISDFLWSLRTESAPPHSYPMLGKDLNPCWQGMWSNGHSSVDYVICSVDVTLWSGAWW